MSVLSAAIEILKKAGSPLHAKDLASQMIAEGLWNSDGKTPAATVSARLYSGIKTNGDKSPFEKVGPQIFALKDSAGILNDADETTPDVQKAAEPPVSTTGFSFTDCAQKVLEAYGGKKPMHYKEITEKALQKGWLVMGGKTPDATMYAQVITEIKRQQKRGERPRFVQHGRGYVGLSQWMGRGLAFQIEQHNHQVRKTLCERLLAMKPGEFEELISQLLAEMGIEMVEVTKLSGDGGIDVCPWHPGGWRRGPHQDGRPGQEMEAQEQHPGPGGSAGARQSRSARARANHHHQRLQRRSYQGSCPTRQDPHRPDERRTARDAADGTRHRSPSLHTGSVRDR